MSSPRHSRVLAILLSLVPGWGHVYLGLDRTGLGLFTVTAGSAFVFFNAYMVYAGDLRIAIARVAAAATILLWAAGIADVGRRTSSRRLRAIEEKKAALLRSGMVAYLRDDLGGAEADFRSCLKLDPQELEALLRLGVVLSRRGDAARARRLLRRARALDFEGKWSWEVGRELADLRANVRRGGAGGGGTSNIPAKAPAAAEGLPREGDAREKATGVSKKAGG